MYALKVWTRKSWNGGLILQITKALPITLNAPIKAPPIAAPREPAINGF